MNSKTLMIFAIIAVAFALFNLIVTINKVGDLRVTGYDIEIGEANLTIEGVLNIIFTRDAIEWGSGSINTTCDDFGILETSVPSSYCITAGGWDDTQTGLVLENQGSVMANVTFNSSNDASGFIPEQDPANPPFSDYEWKVSEGAAGHCETDDYPNSYVDVSTAAIPLCTNFTTTGILTIDINITIPSDADITPPVKQSFIQVTAVPT